MYWFFLSALDEPLALESTAFLRNDRWLMHQSCRVSFLHNAHFTVNLRLSLDLGAKVHLLTVVAAQVEFMCCSGGQHSWPDHLQCHPLVIVVSTLSFGIFPFSTFYLSFFPYLITCYPFPELLLSGLVPRSFCAPVACVQAMSETLCSFPTSQQETGNFEII